MTTAGIAAARPSAVASSASAMPGATMARLVACDFEMPMKLFMMPHTVPNRPTNGAVAPILASAIVQVTNDANARPIITAFTTMSAERNMPHGERSRGSCAAALVGGEAGSFAGATAGACGSTCRGPAAAAAGAGALGGGVCADAGQQTIAASSNAAQACATGPSMILSNLFIQYLAFRF